MQNIKIPVKPGSMATDVVENDIGTHRHLLVQNLRQEKIGEWKNVRGYIDSYDSSGTSLVNGIEVSDDLSGDRFLIYQEGTAIKRLDYDSSNSPNTGYESETPATLALPAGVTIAASAKCRFFYHNGIIRISGSSEPLWYGYISNRQLFLNSWEVVEFQGFESGTAGWTNFSSTISQYDCDADLDATGMLGAPELVNALKVVQTSNDGSARGSFATTVGRTYRLCCMIFASVGKTGNLKITLGASAYGGTEFGSFNEIGDGNWELKEFTQFVATGSVVFMELVPSDGAANDTAYFDFILFEERADITIDGWFLRKAQIESDTINTNYHLNLNDTTGASGAYFSSYLKTFVGYDDAQYALPVGGFIDSDRAETDLNNVSLLSMRLPGAALKTTFANPRLTSLRVLTASYEQGDEPANLDGVAYTIDETIDFTQEDNFSIKALRDNCYYNSTYKNRINFFHPGGSTFFQAKKIDGYLFRVGQRINIGIQIDTSLTGVQSANVIVTEINTTEMWVEISSKLIVALPLMSGVSGVRNFIFTINKEITYDAANGYDFVFGADFLGVTKFTTLTGFPITTKDINPDYSHRLVVNGRPYCLSLEDEEQDVVRYGPIDQYDVFPNTFIIQTPVGDIDQNIGLVERDYRFVILKRNSISQGQFQSSSFYHDRKGKQRGLYVTDGYIVIDDVLYFMDEDDILMFNGVNIREMLTESLIRQEYIDNVDQDNSFFVYNKLDKELWAVLNGTVLVFHFERNSWYIRKTDITPKFGVVDIDNRVFMASTAKFVLYNHSATTFDESIICKITTGLVDLKNPENHKRLHLAKPRVKSNVNLMLQASDVGETGSFSSTKTPDSTKVAVLRYKPKYLFKELTMSLIFAAATNVAITLKEFGLTIGAWRNAP